MNDDNNRPITLADLKALFAEQNQSLDIKFDAIDARFKTVDARFDEQNDKFTAIDARFDEQNRMIDARFDEQNEQIATHIIQPLAELREDVDELKATVTRIENRLDATNNQVDDHEVRIKQLESLAAA